ncbi:MAG: hypothetical protein CMM93_04295 [Rickettsiales bacterium]|nr:hypothetical protein [Rickettsiales bacterium]
MLMRGVQRNTMVDIVRAYRKLPNSENLLPSDCVPSFRLLSNLIAKEKIQEARWLIRQTYLYSKPEPIERRNYRIPHIPPNHKYFISEEIAIKLLPESIYLLNNNSINFDRFIVLAVQKYPKIMSMYLAALIIRSKELTDMVVSRVDFIPKQRMDFDRVIDTCAEFTDYFPIGEYRSVRYNITEDRIPDAPNLFQSQTKFDYIFSKTMISQKTLDFYAKWNAWRFINCYPLFYLEISDTRRSYVWENADLEWILSNQTQEWFRKSKLTEHIFHEPTGFSAKLRRLEKFSTQFATGIEEILLQLNQNATEEELLHLIGNIEDYRNIIYSFINHPVVLEALRDEEIINPETLFKHANFNTIGVYLQHLNFKTDQILKMDKRLSKVDGKIMFQSSNRKSARN